MNFFDGVCQTGPHQQTKFGLCDDPHHAPAWVNTYLTQEDSWIATVTNSQACDIMFTAIDKCVIRDGDEPGRGRCDGMLTTDDQLFLVELKNARSKWRTHAKNQIVSTIDFLKQHHQDQLHQYTRKKAYICNKAHPSFEVIGFEERQSFAAEHGFRLHVGAEINIS